MNKVNDKTTCEKLRDAINGLQKVLEDHEKRISVLEKQSSKIKRRVKKKGLRDIIDSLISQKYFKQKRTIKDVANELTKRGYNVHTTDISGPLRDLVRSDKLKREKEKVENRLQYVYFSG
jgi:septation ring formation regulator EzrA